MSLFKNPFGADKKSIQAAIDKIDLSLAEAYKATAPLKRRMEVPDLLRRKKMLEEKKAALPV